MTREELANLHRHAFAVPGLATKYENIVAKHMHKALTAKPEPVPVKIERLEHYPRGPEIMALMQDRRERTAADVAVRLGCSPRAVAKPLGELAKLGYLALHSFNVGYGPEVRMYRLP
jgi:hypothetical protein